MVLGRAKGKGGKSDGSDFQRINQQFSAGCYACSFQMVNSQQSCCETREEA